MYKNIARPTVFRCFFQYTICVHPDPHPYLALLLHRDYFGWPDASLACFSVPQRLFQPIGFIPILLFYATGIIFSRPDASLSSSFSSQGLFLADRMHLYLDLLCHRDYFGQPDASLACSFLPQGLFQPARFISISLFCSTGIISTGQMHPCLPHFHHRDYFNRSDTSPIAESISARPFRHIPSNSRSVYFNVQVNEIIPFFQSARMLPLYFSTRFSAMDRPIP